MSKYQHYTLRQGRYGGIDVLGWDQFPSGSILAGQPRKTFLSNFETAEEAQAQYPQAKWSHALLEPQVNLNHLPDENTPVAGGMYPDDI
jgi:hypothetical protein